MRRAGGFAAAVLVLAAVGQAQAEQPPAAKWSMKASIIEACSCPMFYQCYFNTKPSAHGGHEGHDMRFCRFNNAFQVASGRYGETSLDGAKFWVAGDLGDEFSDGEMDWAVLTFDPSVSPAQREGIRVILGRVYPVKWKSFTEAVDVPISWMPGADRAEAKLDGGKAAEVVLTRAQGMTSAPIVIHNLKYWGVPRNEGFVLMPNEVEAYRVGEQAFEFKGTNGFMITFDITSDDVS